MLEYPKIDTLYNRGNDKKVLVGQVRRPEFNTIKYWSLAEKVDGMNIRASLLNGNVVIASRYANYTEDVPAGLLTVLQNIFTADKVVAAFDPGVEATIFGEGFGPGINGGKYANHYSYRLFDVNVGGWWLERINMLDVANKLGVQAVPEIGILTGDLPKSKIELRDILDESIVAAEEGGKCVPEGIVARSYPVLFNRKGERAMWKLKVKDF